MLRLLLFLFTVSLFSQAVLVTGGAGYIGSHVCQKLYEEGYTPIAYDNLKGGHREVVKWGPLVVGDICDQALLVKTMDQYKPVAVMHLAAAIEVRESVENPAKHYRSNVLGTMVLLDAMRQTKTQNLIFSSSCAIYGTPKKIPIREKTPRHPQSPYGQTKLIGETLIKDYEHAYDLKSVILRYFNVAGHNYQHGLYERRLNPTHLITVAFNAILNEKTLNIFGADFPTPDGTAIRDYIHVTDIADAHLKSLAYLQNTQTSNDFNLGSGQGYSVKQVTEHIEKLTKKTMLKNITPRRAGEPEKLIADSTKACEILGWSPSHSNLDDILQSHFEGLKLKMLDQKAHKALN